MSQRLLEILCFSCFNHICFHGHRIMPDWSCPSPTPTALGPEFCSHSANTFSLMAISGTAASTLPNSERVLPGPTLATGLDQWFGNGTGSGRGGCALCVRKEQSSCILFCIRPLPSYPLSSSLQPLVADASPVPPHQVRQDPGSSPFHTLIHCPATHSVAILWLIFPFSWEEVHLLCFACFDTVVPLRFAVLPRPEEVVWAQWFRHPA